MHNHLILSKLPKTIFRLLASLRLAVTLIVLLAAVLAVATLIEADKGRDYARWFIYTQPWFVALLGLLGLNILAAALIRFPWKPRQTGFVITHGGLVVLLVGSIITFYRGVDADYATQRDVSRTKRDIKTFEIRLRCDNEDRSLAVGMTAYVLLTLGK